MTGNLGPPRRCAEEDLDIVGRLETGLRASDPDERAGARELLTLLARRGDLFVETQRRIDRAMPDPVTPNRPGPAGPVYPSPTGRSSKGLVLALAGGAGVLVIALVAVAVILTANRDTGTSVTPLDPSITVPPGNSAFPNAAEQELLDYIPSSVQAGGACSRLEDPIYPQAVGVRCDPNSTIEVDYYQFSNAPEMNSTFDGLVADAQLEPASCEPDRNPEFSGHGTWGDPTAGRVACYLDANGYPWIEWTHDSLNIYSYAFAVGDDNRALRQQLFDFWFNAGP